MKITISINQHTINLLTDLSHARKENKSKCITNLIKEAYSKEPKIQNVIIKN